MVRKKPQHQMAVLFQNGNNVCKTLSCEQEYAMVCEKYETIGKNKNLSIYLNKIDGEWRRKPLKLVTKVSYVVIFKPIVRHKLFVYASFY